MLCTYPKPKPVGFITRRNVMSKLKAALITMFLGTSTAAMAAPSVSFSADATVSWGTSFGPTVRDHRNEPAPAPYQMPSNRQTWITIASSLSMANGRDTVSFARGNDVTAIRLTAQSGYSYIGKAKVRFLDGSTQTITLNQWIPSTGLQLTLDRNHRGVDSMVVTGSISGRRSTYSVSALTSRTLELPRPPVVQPPVYSHTGWNGYDNLPQLQEQAPIMLSSELTFANTTGFREIPVSSTGVFTKLRLQDHGGAMPLAKVIINFTNGQIQTVDNIDRTYSPGEFIDLRLDQRGGGQIAKVYVFTNDTNTPIPNVINGSFNVYAL
jgi:hypothetical protein